MCFVVRGGYYTVAIISTTPDGSSTRQATQTGTRASEDQRTKSIPNQAKPSPLTLKTRLSEKTA